jgi:TPR repeat protein
MMYPMLVAPRTGSGQSIGRAELEFQKKLFSLMEMLAEAGNETAQIYLAVYYQDGYDQIVSKDSQMAIFWLSKAAERGNREASRLMGEIEIE